PSFIAKFAGMRNGVEGPAELAGANVVGANVAGGRGQSFRVAPANDDEVFVDDTGAGESNPGRRERTAKIFAQVDAAGGAERGNGFAGGGVERIEKIHHADEDALVGGSWAGPESQAARGLRADDAGIEGPDELAGGGVEGKDFLGGSDAVETAVN